MLGFVVGLALGYVLDVFWSRTPGLSEEETLNSRYDFFHTMEHYHSAELLLILYLFTGWGILLGVAAALFTSEWTGDGRHPFAVGKTHFRSSTALGICLAVALGIAWLLVQLV